LAANLDQNNALIFFNLSLAYECLENLNQALICLNVSLKIDPLQPVLFSCMARIYEKLGEIDNSITSLDKAIEIKPDYAEAFNNRGISLHAVNKIDEAIASYNKAIEIKPDYAEVFLNKGNAYECIKQFDLSIESYDAAIKIDPGYAEAYSNKSLILLLLGDYERGWDLFAWRSKIGNINKKYSEKPIWLGEDIPYNNTLLIHFDIGYGDFIQFSRYITFCLNYFKNIIVEIPECLINIFNFSNENIQTISETNQLPNFNYRCSIMNLALVTQKEIHNIPQEYVCIYTPPAKITYWQNKLGSKKNKRVGVCWSASSRADIEFVLSRKRSIPFNQFSLIFDNNIEFHSLNKEISADDLTKVEKLNSLTSHHNDLNDFTDTAALMMHMDLIITVDTSVAHLAGALGLKTWIILPYVSDYRWGLETNVSPWYKNIEIFKQSYPGEWSKPLEAINSRLNQFS
jgi:hypothetical protein